MELTIGNKKQFILLNKDIPNFTSNFIVQSTNRNDIFSGFIINSNEAKYLTEIEDKLDKKISKDGVLSGIKNINNNINKLDYYLVLYSDKLIKVFIQINTKLLKNNIENTEQLNIRQQQNFTDNTLSSIKSQDSMLNNNQNMLSENKFSIPQIVSGNNPIDQNIDNIKKIPFYKNKKIIILIVFICLILVWYYFIYKKNPIPFFNKYFNKNKTTNIKSSNSNDDIIEDSYLKIKPPNNYTNFDSTSVERQPSLHQNKVDNSYSLEQQNSYQINDNTTKSIHTFDSSQRNIDVAPVETSLETCRDTGIRSVVNTSNCIDNNKSSNILNENNVVKNSVSFNVPDTGHDAINPNTTPGLNMNNTGIINDTIINSQNQVTTPLANNVVSNSSILDRINNL